MFFEYGHSVLTAVNRWDQLDGIGRPYVAEEHIWPSKYDTSLTVVRRICGALKELEIISICGNGATSLAKKLAIEVKRRGIFPKVAMVTVAPNPNLKSIRKGIIQHIGIGGRQVGSRLLIFDGFWWELKKKDFQTIGIPPTSRDFRIVFTSRNEDMCRVIGRHQIHHIDFLEDEEAWDLFRDIAGKPAGALNETARKIVDECDGFRIPILTIASALKDKPPKVWKNALLSLESSNRVHKSDMEKVFSWMDLSYKLLGDMEAKSMFLICCLFPEDSNIPVEDLVLFSKGLQVFGNIDSMNQARDQVEHTLHTLQKAYFLLDGDEDDSVKLHDIHRDFGVWVSSKLMHPYVMRCENTMEEWPPGTMLYENCRAISFMCKTIEQHPADLKCPNLQLLQLSFGSDSAQLPNGIFKGLQNLKVISLSIPSLTQPLSVLTKLRTLHITESRSDNRYKEPRPRIGDLLGDQLENLEVFSFSTARPYDDFPTEIGLLHNLRYLRFNRERLKYIPPGVLSKLRKLEELYLPLDFISWGCKEDGGERINASLSEIESLPLTSVTIGTSTGSISAEKLVKKLTRFHVFIGSHVSVEYEFGTWGNSKRLLEVFDVDADDFTASWVSALVWKSESLRLKQVRNLQNIITCQPKEDQNIEFPQWKKIQISDCKELECLVAGQIPWTSFSKLESLKLFGLCNMKELWPGLYLSKSKGSCFGNLGEIEIMFCRKLKYVFSISVAKELRLLQSLQICFCDEMEDIFCREQTNNFGIQVGSSSRNKENTAKGKIQMTDPTVEASSTSNPTMSVKIHQKSKLFSLTSNSLTKRLFGRGKQHKTVTSRQQMEENIRTEERHHELIFPRLKTMEFAYMNNLRIFYNENHSILLPSLQSLSIFQCNRLEAFSYGLFETPLLQQIQINGNRYPVTEDLNTILKNINCSRIDQANNHA